jgi:hypothetical protein
MLKLINEALLERPLEAQFVALMYAVGRHEFVLRIANSGLPNRCSTVMAGWKSAKWSACLGLLPGVEYDEHSVEAEPGRFRVFDRRHLEAFDASGEGIRL